MKIFKRIWEWIKKECTTKTKWIIYSFFALLFLYFFVTKAINWYFDPLAYSLPDDRAYWGTFGDFVGGLLNPFFAFLSFLALLYTIHLQREELKETREFQKKERFESTFFALLEQLNDLNLEAIHIHEKVITQDNLAGAKEKLDSHNVKHYFITLFQLLKFIYSDCTTQNAEKRDWEKFCEQEAKADNKATEDEKFYSNIVRACLSNDVLFLLAINCYCPNNNQKDAYWKYKLLVERYQFFEHLKGQKNPPMDSLDCRIRTLQHEIAVFYNDAFGANQEWQEIFIDAFITKIRSNPKHKDFDEKISNAVELYGERIRKLITDSNLRQYLQTKLSSECSEYADKIKKLLRM